MTRAGRKSEGPALVRRLDGSDQAKQRLETILATIAGQLCISEACQILGIEQSMFFRLRGEVLQASLAQLEPRPRGRPPAGSLPGEQRCAALEQRIEELEVELKIAAVRDEVARILPRGGQPASRGKKTTHGKSRKTRRRDRGKARRRQP